MKRFIFLFVALLATQAAYSQTRIHNKTPASLRVRVTWDVNNEKTFDIDPDQQFDIYDDGLLIKRTVQAWYNPNPDESPYIDKSQWEKGLQQAIDYTIPNGSLNQVIRIYGYIDPVSQRLIPSITSKPSLDLNREDF